MGKRQKKIALYMRLSREDGDRAESESIENQRRLLIGFVQRKCPEWEWAEYVDEGYSGTTFDRPAFLRLLSDIEGGRVDGVAVKDLSRLGREYIQTGYFLESFFPRKGIRFLSANDAIDSQEEEGSPNRELLISFKNLINDEYARDISVKVKSALRAKKETGLYACAFCPYGYRKGEDGRVGVFWEEGKVVQSIFRWFLGGEKQKAIAGYLNELALLPPSLSKGEYSRYKNCGCKDKGWNYQSVHRILRSPCYTGQAILARTHTISHKVRKTVKTQPERQIFYAIPEIVAREEFEAVQSKIGRGAPKSPGQKKGSFLSGFLVCAACGGKMYLKKGAKKEYFVCATYKNAGKNACSSHYIDKNKLEKTILTILHNVKLSEETINSVKRCYIDQNTSCEATTFKSQKDGNFLTDLQKVNITLEKPAFLKSEEGKKEGCNRPFNEKEEKGEFLENGVISLCLADLPERRKAKKGGAQEICPSFSPSSPLWERTVARIQKITVVSHLEICLHLKCES